MIGVAEALEKIAAHVQPLPICETELSRALGLVLAEEIISDADAPPFDKSMMDGFAVRLADLQDGEADLNVVGELMAGDVPSRSIEPGQAIRIMTGAPTPKSCDLVVPIELTESITSNSVRIRCPAATSGLNIIRQGSLSRAGATVVKTACQIRPQEIGALAESGSAIVHTYRRPRIAVLATGNELVPVDVTPGPGQIRNSNESMLIAQIQRAGGEPVPLGIARDEQRALSEKIDFGLECDMLLLSGGVSAGQLDLVPSTLEAAGVQQIFHKVNVKPGKPLWFGMLRGTGGAAASDDSVMDDDVCCVFGLPGNPVSSMVGFELFVRTAIRRMLGQTKSLPETLSAVLSQEHIAQGPRPTYHPAVLWHDGTQLAVRPIRWQGSSDLRATVDANAMAVFPGEDKTFRKGEMIGVIPWDPLSSTQ